MYYSCKITLLKLNYNIYNKELLSIVVVFKKQKAFLQIIELFIVKIYSKNLMGFLTIKELNKKQVQQVKTLIEYYFKIKYTKSSDNV